ncbi:unnamed protein product [Owenia fusiformis]|uniref:Uncharacterized protein n=1 Tax=Owenia fusiformis TaxID=6347 RepID=A0A8J1TQD0_OWEFU|nr:unnamed protein product [Owenia fusiformis]
MAREMESKSKSSRIKSCLGSSSNLIYISHALSAWGIRMWSFAVALFLVQLSPDSLRLPAIYGLLCCLSVLLCGALIGEWIDNNERLKVARNSLVFAKVCVAICAVLLCMLIIYKEPIIAIWDGWLETIFQALVIIIAVLARLGNEANRISIERDWIVVVSRGNESKLASLNAVTRAIDLTTNILAPVLTGQIMTYGSTVVSAIFIAGWNMLSLVIEVWLLWIVYKRYPELASKGQKKTVKKDDVEDENEPLLPNGKNNNSQKSYSGIAKSEQTDTAETCMIEDPKSNDERLANEIDSTDPNQNDVIKQVIETATESDEVNIKPKQKNGNICALLFKSLLTLIRGWKTYMNQEVVLAGMALSTLYFTVLGFDSITTSYAYSQGLSESMVSILMGGASLLGIFGAFLFTQIRKCIALESMGLISFFLQVLCLSPCVLSVWAPGTVFDLRYIYDTPTDLIVNCSIPVSTNILETGIANVDTSEGSRVLGMGNSFDESLTSNGHFVGFDAVMHGTPSFLSPLSIEAKALNQSPWTFEPLLHINSTGSNTSSGITQHGTEVSLTESLAVVGNGSTGLLNCTNLPKKGSNLSIWLLMGGIIASRVGLWLTDLTISQQMQETIHESERGIVNGVQSSLNMFVDTIKFILVIILPRPETFGLMVLLSFGVICLGGVLYFAHYLKCKIRKRKKRGYEGKA